jgi:hypothetical protein
VPVKSILLIAKLFSKLSHATQIIAEATVINGINNLGDF